MLSILLGPDDFSKKEYISTLAKKEKVEAEFFVSIEEKPRLDDLLNSDLFAKIKIVVLQNLLSEYEYEEKFAGKLIESKNYIFFVECKIDKRLAGNKKWLAHKGAGIKEFYLPHGSELDGWILQRVAHYGGVISKTAAALLAQKLGRDNAMETKFGGKVVDVKEIFDLWQADSEIQKLVAYAGSREISIQDVEDLAIENGEVDVLKITNAIADGKKDEALNLTSQFLGQGGEEKALIIQLNAILSEQFRNIFVLQDFLARKISETEILEKTGWKSGRLFVLKKIANRFSQGKVKDLLNKLAALDEELKSTSTPPRVILDLILSQLFVQTPVK